VPRNATLRIWVANVDDRVTTRYQGLMQTVSRGPGYHNFVIQDFKDDDGLAEHKRNFIFIFPVA
jgi:hypothetical protein